MRVSKKPACGGVSPAFLWHSFHPAWSNLNVSRPFSTSKCKSAWLNFQGVPGHLAHKGENAMEEEIFFNSGDTRRRNSQRALERNFIYHHLFLVSFLFQVRMDSDRDTKGSGSFRAQSAELAKFQAPAINAQSYRGRPDRPGFTLHWLISLTPHTLISSFGLSIRRVAFSKTGSTDRYK